jgi:hypothetical protein
VSLAPLARFRTLLDARARLQSCRAVAIDHTESGGVSGSSSHHGHHTAITQTWPHEMHAWSVPTPALHPTLLTWLASWQWRWGQTRPLQCTCVALGHVHGHVCGHPYGGVPSGQVAKRCAPWHHPGCSRPKRRSARTHSNHDDSSNDDGTPGLPRRTPCMLSNVVHGSCACTML